MVTKNTVSITEQVIEEITAIKIDMDQIKRAEEKTRKKMSEMEERINEAERYQRKWNLHVQGVPEEANEDIKWKIAEICGTIVPDYKDKVIG